MDSATLYSIGELSRRTGLSVRTIRFYSDANVVMPAGRSPAGYRLYDIDAVPRLELISTLRELGINLATVQRVLNRELSLSHVLSAHAEAVDAQIRMLRQRRSVLRAAARLGSSLQETRLMHRLVKSSAAERHRLVDDFLAGTFGTEGADANAVAMVRAATPDLPEDPSVEQVAAWVELTELIGDEDFRARMRRAAAVQAGGQALGIGSEADDELTEYTRCRISEARSSGIDPLDDEATPVVEDLVQRFAEALGRIPDAEFRDWLAGQWEVAHDPRVEQYWRLVWVVNGWQVVPELIPGYAWLVRALRRDS
ncbi:MerR family transcriptional regulator [Streptomyces sp. NPDC058872]|uniref:helix-turn-helix domain-containing protein n=1 Tax=Streptomyces sp. NPDC058872 TaxID=3346661 RepID=UPI0036BC2986